MNAAIALADIFQEWAANPTGSIYNARGEEGNGGSTLDYWSGYQKVVDLIADLDYALDVLESKGKPRKRYDALMVRIWRYAVMPENAWQSYNNTAISMDDIHHLQTLGDVIEMQVPQANELPERDRTVVLELLEEARTASLDCFDLPERIRTRLAGVIEQLGILLDPDRDASPRTLHRALDEMTAILLRAVWAEPNPDIKRRLFNLAFRFAHSTAESGSYDLIKAIAAAPVKEMLGLPAGEDA
ncbi:hypothetical protein ACSYDW_07165 [Paeniglutamicibacter sp. R2-26]|uniref:hypothetical protein n=1 Tax=Paeniglutamicibacter sp. R2-26 TaxID=3144417 RepID=UPI003EE4D1A3